MAFVDKDPVVTSKGTGWRVRWKDSNGRSREKVHYGITFTKAEKLARDKEAELSRGDDLDADRSRVRFQELAGVWLDTLTSANPETVANYRRRLEMWVFPEIGNVRLDKLTHPTLTKLFNKIRTSPSQRVRGRRKGAPPPPISATTAERIFGPVYSALAYAAEQGYVRRNPAKGIKFRVQQFRAEPHGVGLEWKQVEAIAEHAAANVHAMYGTVVRFLASTGLRASELAGLQVGDYRRGVGDAPDVIEVRRSAVNDKQGFRYKVTKSRSSVRDIPLDEMIALEMRAFLAKHPKRETKSAPLFPRRRAGGEFNPALQKQDPFNWDKPIDGENLRRRVYMPACRAAGLGALRLHDLRHTAGSLWLAAGWGPFEVSRTLGHSSVDFTMRTYAKQLASTGGTNAARLADYKRGQTRHLRAVEAS